MSAASRGTHPPGGARSHAQDEPGTLLIAGASGIIGGAAVEHFAAQPGWNVIALSRRPPATGGVRHLPLDLCDRERCLLELGALHEVTHVLFAALFEKPDLVAGWQDSEQMATNLAMLRNLLDGIEPAAPGLRHVTLLQGLKAYGSHLGRVPMPAKERWQRHAHANFYWLQEDLLRDRQRAARWTFSILRPQVVFGHGTGSPMNVVAAIGAWAAVMRELGRPLRHPGGGRFVTAATDARLIAQAAHFAGTDPVAANQTYNVANGDVLIWEDVWPAVARHFGMPLGAPEQMLLADEMPRHEGIWRGIVERHGLQPLTLAELAGSSWQFADRSFGHGVERPNHSVMSTIKLRQAGFASCLDTEDALIEWLVRLQQARLIPS